MTSSDGGRYCLSAAGTPLRQPPRRQHPLRPQFQQPQQAGILGLQLRHLVLQRSQFSIQDASLHACHLPAGAA
jgi:hypothetical protein